MLEEIKLRKHREISGENKFKNGQERKGNKTASLLWQNVGHKLKNKLQICFKKACLIFFASRETVLQ